MDRAGRSERGTDRTGDLVTRRRLWLAALALATVTFLLFSPLLNAHFINYDDQAYVTENPHVLGGLTLDSAKWACTSPYMGAYYPVTLLSHMLDVDLFGTWAGGHHLTNLLLHVASALILFAFLWKATRAFGQSLAVALLFAIHPLHVESVAWVAERKDVLSTLFLMVALYAYAGYVRSHSLVRYLAVFSAFLMGLLSKPMVVTAPFLMLLLDYWPFQRFRMGHAETGSAEPEAAGSARPGRQPLWRLVVEKLPLFGLSALFSILAFMTQSHAGAVGGFPLKWKIINALSSYGSYIGKTLVPLNLALFYPMRLDLMRPGEAFMAAVLLLLVLWLGWRWRDRAPYLLVGWLWFLGMLVPVIGLVEIGSMAMGDRYTYVPLVGLFIVMAWGTADALNTGWGRRFRLAAPAIVVGWLIFLAGLTYHQATLWHDSLTLWKHALQVTKENAIAHTCYGLALVQGGRYQEGEENLKRAITLMPDHVAAWKGLAAAAEGEGKVDFAIRCLRHELSIQPDDFQSRVVLARLLTRTEDFPEAESEWDEVLKRAPAYPEATAALRRIHEVSGKTTPSRSSGKSPLKPLGGVSPISRDDPDE